MAEKMTECRACGAKVSTWAPACPRCGRPAPQRPAWVAAADRALTSGGRVVAVAAALAAAGLAWLYLAPQAAAAKSAALAPAFVLAPPSADDAEARQKEDMLAFARAGQMWAAMLRAESDFSFAPGVLFLEYNAGRLEAAAMGLPEADNQWTADYERRIAAWHDLQLRRFRYQGVMWATDILKDADRPEYAPALKFLSNQARGVEIETTATYSQRNREMKALLNAAQK